MADTDAPRWATFDCYGTLVDWNAGIGGQLGRLFSADAQARLLARYHELEPRVQRARPDARYRDVMATVLAQIADDEGTVLPDDERDALGRSLPDWPVFPEVPGALAETHHRGWRLVALTNSDRDLIEASMQAIGVPFDGAVVASEIGSYKPQHGHWRVFYETYGADPARHVHVAQSHFHDVVPAASSGSRRCGSTGWARTPTRRRRASAVTSTGSPTSSTSSSPSTAPLVVAGVGRWRANLGLS